MRVFFETGTKVLGKGWVIAVDEDSEELVIYHDGEEQARVEVDRSTELRKSRRLVEPLDFLGDEGW